MKHCALLLLSLFAMFIPAHAQDILRGKVLDAESQEPVPFVNIGITSAGIGTVSDEAGNFRLRFNSPEEVVTFSAIGYATRHLPAEALAGKASLLLEPRTYSIPMVELKAAGLNKEVVLGAVLNERKHSVGFGSSELGTEIGAHIGIKEETYIKSAHFGLNHAKGDSMLFRVNLYQFEGGEVKAKLLPRDVIIRAAQQEGTIDVDLSEFKLVVDSDVLLSLEWIRDDSGEGNVGITFNAQKSRRDNNVFTKHTSQAPFRRLSQLVKMAPKLQVEFYLKGKQAGEAHD